MTNEIIIHNSDLWDYNFWIGFMNSELCKSWSLGQDQFMTIFTFYLKDECKKNHVAVDEVIRYTKVSENDPENENRGTLKTYYSFSFPTEKDKLLFQLKFL